MESTINMEKEVELHEERAKQAKIEASLAGEDTLVHVEELQCRLNLEKERNDMVCLYNNFDIINQLFFNYVRKLKYLLSFGSMLKKFTVKDLC